VSQPPTSVKDPAPDEDDDEEEATTRKIDRPSASRGRVERAGVGVMTPLVP